MSLLVAMKSGGSIGANRCIFNKADTKTPRNLAREFAPAVADLNAVSELQRA
jgi:hypothetical protein